MTTATIQQKQTPLRVPSYDELSIELMNGYDCAYYDKLREFASEELTRNPQGEIVLCNLAGSDKQIAWAFDIRQQAVLKLKLLGICLFRDREAMRASDDDYEGYRDLTTQHTHFREGVNGLLAITDAKWWIDNRNEIGTALLATAASQGNCSAQRALNAYNTRH